jgi:uncharacterized protein (TIGR02996 family)
MADRTTRPPDRPEVKVFLDEIKDDPDDLTPRLILADWLEERGDPRGTFLRLQCQIASPAAACAPHGASPELLAAQARRVREAREHVWTTGLRHHLDHWDFRRGLMRVTLPAGRLPPPEEPGAGFGLVGRLGRSVEQMFLLMSGSTDSLSHGPLRELLGTETWAWVEEVTLDKVDAEKLKFALASPLVASVPQLKFNGQLLGDVGMEALAAWPGLARLRELSLSGTGVDLVGLLRLVDAPPLRGIRSLSLARNELGAPGMMILAHSQHLAGLRTLSLENTDLYEDAAEVLAEARGLAALRHLDLSDNYLGPVGVAALAGSPLLAGLESLNLSDNAVGEEGARALIASTLGERLARLELYDNHLSDELTAELRERFGEALRV